MIRPTRRSVLAGLAAGAWLPRSALAAADPRPLPDWPGQVVRPEAVFGCGHRPKGIAISPDGNEAWITFLGGPPSVGVYRLPDGEPLGVLTLGKAGAVEAVFSRDGAKLWVSQMETATVHEIDVASRTVLRVMDTRSNWSKIIEPSPDQTRLYVSNWNFDDISEIDLASGETVRRMPTVKTPRGLYATRDGQTLVVCGFGDGGLDRITLKTGARQTIDAGHSLRHVVSDADERFLYLTDMGARRVRRVELATFAVTDLARTDANANTCALTPDGRVLAVSCRGPNGSEGYMADGPAWGSVLLIDPADGAVLDSIIGGNQCTGLAISPDGRRLLFSDFRDDTIRVYQLPPYEQLKAAGWPRRDLHAGDLWKKKKPAPQAPPTPAPG